MKTAIVITGLPRKVKLGYNSFWKKIIEKYNPDIYLHFWEDYEHELVLDLYKPTKYVCEKPFSFKKYTENTIPEIRYTQMQPVFEVIGVERSFPMYYGWQSGSRLLEGEYDCVIKGRFDLNGYVNFDNIDFTKINLNTRDDSKFGFICEDNLFISNSTNFKKVYDNIFEDLILYINENDNLLMGGEYHFTKLLQHKKLDTLILANNLQHTVLKSMSFIGEIRQSQINLTHHTNFELLKNDKTKKLL